MSNWQDIDTAPKDGSYFLAYWPDNISDIGMMTHLTQWNQGDEFEEGWYCFEQFSTAFGEPTHWMPFPEAPFDDRQPIGE